MKIREIYDYIDTFAPFDTQCDWDNSGLLIGNMETEVKKIGFALDATNETIGDAIAEGCNLIITHHPIIFNPLKNVDIYSPVYKAISNGISVLCCHTCLDKSDPGVNTILAETTGLDNIKAFDVDSDAKMCRMGSVRPQSADDFAELLKNRLHTSVSYADAGIEIKTVAVCGGAAGEYIYTAHELGCDALVTGEVKHHEYINAKEMGLSVFCAGHFETENPVIPMLKSMIETKFSADCVLLKQTPPAKYTGV